MNFVDISLNNKDSLNGNSVFIPCQPNFQSIFFKLIQIYLDAAMHNSSVLCITEEDNLPLNTQYSNHVHNNNTYVFRTFPD